MTVQASANECGVDKDKIEEVTVVRNAWRERIELAALEADIKKARWGGPGEADVSWREIAGHTTVVRPDMCQRGLASRYGEEQKWLPLKRCFLIGLVCMIAVANCRECGVLDNSFKESAETNQALGMGQGRVSRRPVAV